MEFRILGPLEVLDGGRPIPLDRKLTRALLAYLLLHANEPASADRLIEELWGGSAPRTAAASLQNYVSRLRKLIGAERVVSGPAGYVLRVDPERLDVAKFDRLVGRGAHGFGCRTRPAASRRARALARPAARGSRVRAVRAGGDRSAHRAAACGDRGPNRSRARSRGRRPPRRGARGAGRRASAA